MVIDQNLQLKKLMKHRYFLFIVACFWYYHSANAENVLTFFLNPYPQLLKKDQCDEALATIAQPGRLAEYCVYGILDKKSIAGIFATYAGYLAISDDIGQITFPLLHRKPTVRVLITNRLTPIMMLGNTLHHWELDKDVPATMYAFDKEFDEMTQLYYWNAHAVELPKNGHITVDTVVILAKPHYIYVAEGLTPIEQPSPHYILPTMYVKKGINLAAHALYMLNLSNFYAPIKDLYKQGEARYLRLLNI